MVKKRAEKENLGALNKEFEIFSKGIERLEELRRELDSLNTRGFERDAAVIRSKLKDVSAIPLLEIQLKSLKNKINRKYIPRHKKSSKLKTQIKHLEEEIEDIPKLERKINDLRQRLKEKKSIKVKKQLSKEELESVKDIPSLESEIRSLSDILRRHLTKARRPKLPVDESMAALVESKFGDLVYGIEKELSERIKKREESMDKRLKYDLEFRESAFKNKYKSLVDKSSQLYEDKIKTELKRDVARRFNKELMKKIRSLKTKVKEDYIPRLKKEAHSELNKKRKELKQKAADTLRSKKHAFAEHYNKQKAALIRDYHNKREVLVREYDRKLEISLEGYKHEKTRLSSAYAKRNSSLRGQYAEKDRMIMLREEHLQKLHKEKMSQLKKYKDELSTKLREEAHKKMIAEIHQEEERLRRDLRDRFNEKLRLELQRRQQEFDKKKLELELAIRKQAKAMLR